MTAAAPESRASASGRKSPRGSFSSSPAAMPNAKPPRCPCRHHGQQRDDGNLQHRGPDPPPPRARGDGEHGPEVAAQHAGGPHGGHAVPKQQHEGARPERGGRGHVEQAQAAHRALELHAERVDGGHVHEQVQQVAVHEHGGDQPVPLASLHGRTVERGVGQQLRLVRGGERGQHAPADEQPRHHRAPGGVLRRRRRRRCAPIVPRRVHHLSAAQRHAPSFSTTVSRAAASSPRSGKSSVKWRPRLSLRRLAHSTMSHATSAMLRSSTTSRVTSNCQ